VIVVAEPPEVVESGHFEVGAGESSGQFFADGVKEADAGLFLDALREKFLRPRGAFLG